MCVDEDIAWQAFNLGSECSGSTTGYNQIIWPKEQWHNATHLSLLKHQASVLSLPGHRVLGKVKLCPSFGIYCNIFFELFWKYDDVMNIFHVHVFKNIYCNAIFKSANLYIFARDTCCNMCSWQYVLFQHIAYSIPLSVIFSDFVFIFQK